MEEVSTTDPMVILREKGGCRAKMNLLIRASAHDTMRNWIVISLHQIKKVERETKTQRMVRINNNPVENNGCRLNPDSSSGIFMTSVIEPQCRIVAKNRKKQDEVK